MKALTLIRPMDLALADPRIGKDVENRSWQRSPGLVSQWQALRGQRLAIHAGQKYDGRFRAFIRRLTGIDLPPENTSPGHIVGLVTVAGLEEWSGSRWYVNDHDNLALLVRDPVLLDQPVRCGGFQGLWTVPTGAERELKAQLIRRGIQLQGDVLAVAQQGEAR